MFRRLLVANRGEVAARVVRTCRRLGIDTVAICSAADRTAAWLEEADRVVCIGGAHPRDSYLDADAILEVARRERCSALHPGWGFLSENAFFAARCEAIGVRFVGPPPPVLHLFGDKLAARRLMQAHGLPVIPGTMAPVRSLVEARREAARLGYPVLVKAAAGGGGRGLKVAADPSTLEQALQEASAQASSAFGQEEVYLERLLRGGRHVEFQILVDRAGTARCLGERECSLQRDRQKLMEESPCARPLTAAQRALGLRAAEAMAAAGYQGAGTVEMLLDPEGHLCFMECNARLQVEHGVTEATTGLDLVEWQLRIAAGERLGTAPAIQGHAVECRINAEDPAHGFRPGPGALTRLELPHGPGIRVDTHLRRAGPAETADRIPPHYDSLICKLIAHGADRPQALERMAQALRDTRIGGVPTTIPLHRALLKHPDVQAGRIDTAFLEERFLPRWRP
ncbi:MAG: biotin carboxylase N-terminal domain-containing protein [Pseudomonadota bacterium]